MSTKSDMADRLNGVFDVSIDWSKMSKEDLETLLKVVEEPVSLVQLGLKRMKSKAKDEVLNRPLGELLGSTSILDNFKIRSGGGGPLGLGILPAVFGGEKKSSGKVAASTTEKAVSESKPLVEKHENEQKPQP